jgi:hypothetical protein
VARHATAYPTLRPSGLNTTTTAKGRKVPYQAGDVLLADLDPVTGHEQGGRRPVLVLSGSSYNELRNEQLTVAAVQRVAHPRSYWPRKRATRAKLGRVGIGPSHLG